MADIDFGLALDFVDPSDGVPRQLRFTRNWAPPGDPRVFDGTGQLVAVVADRARPDDGHTIALTRPNVHIDDVEKILDGWESWARITSEVINLAQIRRRIVDAGLS
jgi:hypothetical protein